MSKVPYEPVVPQSLGEIDFLDAKLQNCPYHAYKKLRDEAPVWRDPITGMYVITRFDDLRDVLLDPENFINGARPRPLDAERARRMRELYETKGWLPAPTLAGRDDPNHKEMRTMFNEAFRPKRINAMDPFVAATAYKLIDAFIDAGRCDWVKQFAVPLPLIVIGHQVGVPEADIWQIKQWTDAWVQRIGAMQTEAQERWSVEMEIEAQHYFQKVFERLRKAPDDTLLSDMVNRVIPEWGRPLTDNELHAEMMADTFVGGSETTTNAISAGVMLLIQNPDVWQRLKAEPDRHLKTFIEEVLRLECPVQGLFRTAARDVELHGVTIPKGAAVNVRYAAANRDEREFENPDRLDLDRDKPGRHLAFGSGVHHCLGAPLARRELYWSFKALTDRIDEMWFVPDANDFTVQPNFALRALNALHIEFRAKAR
ncbi:MAG TPA: cytochrome P450 [Pseudomonadales bacterium]|nr:cytochrome P450 [Pseudomonadales bacterium]